VDYQPYRPAPEPEPTEPAIELPTMDDLRALAADLDDIDATLTEMDAAQDGLVADGEADADDAAGADDADEAGEADDEGQTPSLASR
jgi:hypothetical protein